MEVTQTPAHRTAATLLPGVLLVATFLDDPIFGSAIAGLQVAIGPLGVLVAALGFTLFSVLAALATLWAVRTAPLRLSDRMSLKLERIRTSRVGKRIAAIDDHHLVTTMVVASVLGSVAPLILATVGNSGRPVGVRTAIAAGVSYGLVFSLGYGLIGTVINIVV
jgi:hypothetical protein